jgi:cytochrome c-type biogenesis protein CcmF
MIVLAGRISLAVALVAALATAVTSLRAARADGETGDRRFAARAAQLSLAALLTAFSLLEFALLTDDFGVRFVANNHSRATSLLFTITSAWSGLEGSLLLWAAVIGLYLAIVARRVGRLTEDRIGSGAVAVMAIIAAFFTGLVLFVAPTFTATAEIVTDGRGANPLLQDNVLMAIHPPLLYLGYVGFMVPFSFAVSALGLRERGPRWVLRTQRWALVAWTFLTAGIVIGGWWSYEVLGWGGYWAWDPVENASFLPWLVGTAYLHSAVIQARRGLLPAWSVGLVISSFVFTLLGTFLARSGVIASVHAFSGSTLGPVLLVFLILVIVSVGWLFVSRLGDVVSGPKLDSLVSREGMLLLNNLLLAFFAAVVLIGTLSPIVLEALNGDRSTIGRPFFDVWAVWISLALMLAMLVGVVAPYRRSTIGALWEHQRLSVQIGLAVAGVAVGFGLRAPFVIAVLALCGAISATAVREFATAVEQRTDARGRTAAAIGALRANPGFWGGQIAHVGLAVVCLGIATSSSLAERGTINLRPGGSGEAAGFTITYIRPTAERTAVYESQGAIVRLERAGESRIVSPEFHQYPNRRDAIAVPAVWTTGRGDDAYVSLQSLGDDGLSMRVIRYPWLFLIWVGGLMMAAGGVASMVFRRLRSRSDRRIGEPFGVPAVSDSRDPSIEAAT